MIELQLAHTADLDATALARARGLLDMVFGEDLDDHDWDHALGGIHAIVWEGRDALGHASLVQRRLLHGEHAYRAGYVEAVGVRPDRRREGLGSQMMEALQRVILGAYELGALGATPMGARFYQALGWQRWRGSLSALTPTGPRRTPQERNSIYVYPVTAPLDLDGELTADWREGDVW
jgi:aminoglycoside 2'-N-acetyltransferase I